MFRGTTSSNLDSKGRLTIPSRYRDELELRCAGKMVVSIDFTDPCLSLYPLSEWEKIEAKLLQLPSLRADTRRLSRLLIGSAVDVELDANCRILIPSRLREHAQITKEVTLVGQLNRFQLWSAECWDAVWTEDLQSLGGENDLSSELLELVL
ncbi:cell division protein MraZ [Thiopseudomonas alkaliphila]|uniref:Transcriptional regulator MraZ n=1 Tax=Thiopseudomonas alkaliphila TaxID=1697053 RepID=A0A0K1XFT0_9GAMM|nr:division/cell wall cluster transcriptional repressor MraZ [Thiopseudomonas alkaliphila]AKX43726.1 cell division protein MraZ [Thiopseudomonas alkaliphila]AKX45983.1 cell division protein MraZ [Thiopseudomonas alkaliphila]AKX49067.1 cell division protein MraZ [Thiopseudomonas alkaliphila]AKX51762.1 cell division protein MraZ [Thiopseudomonas alkaliphila]AKX53038.1 cell division protein MraZ [Thiopseudomonas alkaliphila]